MHGVVLFQEHYQYLHQQKLKPVQKDHHHIQDQDQEVAQNLVHHQKIVKIVVQRNVIVQKHLQKVGRNLKIIQDLRHLHHIRNIVKVANHLKKDQIIIRMVTGKNEIEIVNVIMVVKKKGVVNMNDIHLVEALTDQINIEIVLVIENDNETRKRVILTNKILKYISLNKN